MPDIRGLEYLLLKKKEYKHKVKIYKRKFEETNTKYFIVHEDTKIEAVEHFSNLLKDAETDITRVKAKEYRIMGTIFVTFTPDLDLKVALKMFKEAVKAPQHANKVALRLGDWTYDKAPIPSDIDWKNLIYD